MFQMTNPDQKLTHDFTSDHSGIKLVKELENSLINSEDMKLKTKQSDKDFYLENAFAEFGGFMVLKKRIILETIFNYWAKT